MASTVAASVDAAFPLAVVMTVSSFDNLISFFTRSELSLAHHVGRCAVDHNEFSVFTVAT